GGGSGTWGYRAGAGRSSRRHRASKDKRYIRGLDTPGSSLTTPLMLNDRVIGVFNVESAKTGAFSEDDRHFAEIFSRYVAMALHMLNLLVSERIATSETTTGRMADVLQEPLNDLAVEAEWLKEQAAADPGMLRHVDRIQRDIEAMRRRIQDVARGPKTILGVEKELEESREDPLLSGRRVLVADDDLEIRDLIRDVLKKRGARVATARTGAEAIREIEHATASKDDDGPRQGFALIVSDIKMPDRNGYEVFSAARKRDAGLPVILMTGFGYDPHHSIVRASQEGLQCVLFKPFQIEKLIEEVHKALMGPTPPGP
ncbi:MAG: response regulator, partial [Phycisphaerales bacterium]|nr:response regulator [Phycisphaerales bacterium]